MGRLAQTDGLTEFEQDILATVRDFTNREIIPVATELEHRDEYPARIVAGMKKLGLFGLTIGEEYGGLGASLLLYALAVEEIARGWMSVSGIINTHFIVAHMIARHGTDEQKAWFLPGWRPARCAAPSPCPNPAWARTSPPSAPGRCATATTSSSTGRRCG
jgi:alkylation response protein AidB-like acyl-CoA dehydrogenase